ncbi:MAG TPA: glycosyltransferase [Lutibacter sp.]
MNVKKIKILYTIPNFDTAGSGKVVYDLVKGLDKQKFDPTICCFHTKGEFFEEIKQLGVKIYVFPFAINYRPYVTFPIRLLKIVHFFKKHQFDIIHSWHWSSDFSEPLAAKLAGIPFVYTKKAMGWGNKAWLWRSKLSSKIIYINKDMGTQFFSMMKEKAVQIPLGVDTQYFQPVAKIYNSPEGITFRKDDFVIVSVANLVPVKGIEVLLQAVEKMNDSHIKILIVGDANNEYGLELQKQFQADNNYFLGKKSDVRPYLAMADVFVIPTKEIGEGMPIAPLEAMASQRIVLGSKVAGIKDILAAFEHCLFEPNDVDDMIEKILYIMNKPISERNILAKTMRAYVEKEFDIETVVCSHEKLYKNLV